MRKNGCHNRPPFKETMLVQSGYYDDSWFTGERTARWITSPFRMARECQFTRTELGKIDPGCNGCKHKEAE